MADPTGLAQVQDIVQFGPFVRRVQAALVQHALSITAVPPTNETMLFYNAARQVIQTNGQGVLSVAVSIVAFEVGADPFPEDAAITAAIEKFRHDIYNIPRQVAQPKYSPNNPEFLEYVQSALMKAAQGTVDSANATAAQKTTARQMLGNPDLYAKQIATIASANPKGTPLNDETTKPQADAALLAAYNTMLG